MSWLCNGPSAPVFFGQSLHRRSIRVLALDPIRRATGSISRVLPLRHDAFEPELACVCKHERPILLVKMFVEPQARYCSPEQARKRRLAHGKRVAPEIVAVQLDQVEGVEEHTRVMVAVPDALKGRNAVLAARDRLSVDDAGP